MQNILSLNSFKQQLEEHERAAILLFDPENESSRSVFRSITEATYLSEKLPVFVADIREVSDIQSHFQVPEIPSLLFFVKAKLVEVVNGSHESEFTKALINNDFAKE
ncbi:MAG TPA: hypothetical protein DCL77_15590 [Prolixibacteraceae bacterium]|jgi:Xaa-Pro aminopeptidase|nr:hypothetical protein [Prolixibacteraceae bacterium]